MLKYYSDNALKRIKLAKNYQDLFKVAINVLETIHNLNPIKPIAMVCGPISSGVKGSRKENLEVFSRAIDRLANDGLLIFSQMPFEDDMERIYKSNPALQGIRLLEEFYLPIFKTGFIKIMCFLPNWEKSVGATWEHEQAKRLGIPRIYLANSYIAN